jgi:hypothetical protein
MMRLLLRMQIPIWINSLIFLYIGKPILGAIGNEKSLLLASIVWWTIFYSPGDIVYQGIQSLPNNSISSPWTYLPGLFFLERCFDSMFDSRTLVVISSVTGRLIAVYISLPVLRGIRRKFFSRMSLLYLSCPYLILYCK